VETCGTHIEVCVVRRNVEMRDEDVDVCEGW
jgi:hypothetical protein